MKRENISYFSQRKGLFWYWSAYRKPVSGALKSLTFRKFRGFVSAAADKFGHNAGSMGNRTLEFSRQGIQLLVNCWIVLEELFWDTTLPPNIAIRLPNDTGPNSKSIKSPFLKKCIFAEKMKAASEASPEGCSEMGKWTSHQINITIQLHLPGLIGTASHPDNCTFLWK